MKVLWVLCLMCATLALHLDGQTTEVPQTQTKSSTIETNTATHITPTVVNEPTVPLGFDAADIEDILSADDPRKRALPEEEQFDGLSLDEQSSSVATRPSSQVGQSTDAIEMGKNIYKVAKGKAIPATGAGARSLSSDATIAANTTSDFHSFDVFKRLFDQNKWNVMQVTQSLFGQCAQEMRSYLLGLDEQVPWAMQASDQSGRYRGMFFYGNEYWVGNEMFCIEVNTQRSKLPAPQQQKQPIMQFFAATFTLSMPVLNHMSKLQLGQCLPASCTITDVATILRLDPAVIEMNDSDVANITLIAVRPVPGAYALWPDQRFQLLMGILIVCVVFTFIATVHEITSKRLPTKLRKTPTTAPSNGIYDHNTTTMTNNNNNVHIGNGHTNQGFIGKHVELHQVHQQQQQVDNNNGIAVIGSGDLESHAQQYQQKKQLDRKVSPEVQMGFFHRLVLCFGFFSNSRAIISSHKLPEESVSCIHGMRVFSMLWTIMVHTYLQMFGISENKFGRTITERKFWYQVIGNATYSVDTFFFISGLLVVLLYLRSEEKIRRKRNALEDAGKTVMLFLYRYVRLTPVYFVALLCSELSLKYIYNGSVFNSGLDDHSVCPKFYWRNILYIQNWFPFPQLCMIWSWYLANDMQFYVWAIIILAISSRYFKASVTLVIAFLLSSWVISAWISISFNYTIRLAEPLDSFGFLYDKPWTRIGPYIMGMIAGLLIFKFKEPPKVSRFFNISMWIVSMVIMFMIIFGVWDGHLSVVASAYYVSLSHTGWGVALIWITLSCRWGYARPVNKFLSYSGFLPLSRLTYCTYLIHPVTQIVTAFQMQGPMHLMHLMIVTVFLGNAIVSYATAFVLSVLCEAPVVRILRIFFQK